MLIEIEYEKNKKRYSIQNDTEYKNVEYYTITKDNSNNKIDISFHKYDKIDYMQIEVKKAKLPKNVYDIVVDPGHRRL